MYVTKKEEEANDLPNRCQIYLSNHVMKSVYMERLTRFRMMHCIYFAYSVTDVCTKQIRFERTLIEKARLGV